MVESHPSTKVGTESVEHKVKNLGVQSASFLERYGINRLLGGLLLVVLGILVLAFPQLITGIIGVGAIVLGILVLLFGLEQKTSQ